MARLDGKVAIVTGGARGLGGATVDVLAEEGATVLIADVIDEAGEARATALRAKGHKAEYHHLDVRDADAWAALVDTAMHAHGHLDVLVNNAGINISITIEDATAQQFRDVLEVNLIGAFLGTKAVIPAMRSSGGGSIINIASNSTQMVLPLTTIYGASKSALANLTKTTAVHCAQRGYNIRVNSVHPGAHETEMLTGGTGMRPLDIPQVKALIDAIPMGRMGQPRELGKVVAFLASDDSSYMTTSELFSDGGLTVVSFGGDPALRG
ncbi:SDR family NAD(P)-dependent oxidoreductase [Acidocella sp. KAb 2-4]|uniref:SDR family NAD(P)-dependent oxidoreductase n=1 Tax=Acidocella sp. KAb 2-4 TaxID=2885158 RepID=UPI001D086723|nr:glucose 1-dehydrogenase [Acidocella sp. KAb 2-4]MCB5945565.1 glucose 1-dehydrogenase [Acidocella sp. KAb 2-4]